MMSTQHKLCDIALLDVSTLVIHNDTIPHKVSAVYYNNYLSTPKFIHIWVDDVYLDDVISNLPSTLSNITIYGVRAFMAYDISRILSIKIMRIEDINIITNTKWQLYIPRCITELTIVNCKGITSIDELPESLTTLCINRIYNNMRISDNLPIYLVAFRLPNSQKYSIEFDYMPPYLRELKLHFELIRKYNDNANYYIANNRLTLPYTGTANY